MQLPVAVNFFGMQASAMLRADIEDHAHRLLGWVSGLQSCQVTVTRSEQDDRQGDHYRVRIDARLPGRCFRISHPEDDARGSNAIDMAVLGAFDALRRQIADGMHARVD